MHAFYKTPIYRADVCTGIPAFFVHEEPGDKKGSEQCSFIVSHQWQI